MLRRRILTGILLTASVILNGCGDEQEAVDLPDPKPVSGTVTYAGEILADARVFFSPKGSTQGQGASGTTDSQGTYVLSTLNAKGEMVNGCIPGEYKVTVSRIVRPDGTAVSPDSQEPPIMSGGMESIPLEFSDYTMTKLTANVGAEGGTVDLVLEPR